MNKVQLEGFCEWEPRSHPTVTAFSLRVENGPRGFTVIPCVIFPRELGDLVIREGGFYQLEGRVVNRSRAGKDGKPIWETQVVAESMTELRHKSTDAPKTAPRPASPPASSSAKPAWPPPRASSGAPSSQAGYGGNGSGDDIPF